MGVIFHRNASALVLLFAIMASLLSACGASGPEQLRVAVKADEGANQDSPTAVAVLVVYNEDLMKELRTLTAADWFSQADQRKRDNPDRIDFDIFDYEVPPDPRQGIGPETVSLQGRPAQGIIFAGFHTEGAHRERFNPTRGVLIYLSEEDFGVSTLEEEEEDEE